MTRITWRIICVAFCCSACATPPQAPTPPPEIIRVEVPRVEQRVCPDRRPPRDVKALPIDPEDLAAIPVGDYEGLGKAYWAAIEMLRVWLDLDEVQIKACSTME